MKKIFVSPTLDKNTWLALLFSVITFISYTLLQSLILVAFTLGLAYVLLRVLIK